MAGWANAQGPQLSGTLTSPAYNNGAFTVNLVVTNTGTTAANNIVIGQLAAKVLSGTGSVSVSSPALPLSVGSLAAQASATVPLTFAATLPVTRFTIVETGTVQDASSNSYNFSISQLAILPSTTTLSISPGSLTYAPQGVGTTSPAQSVTVSNTGTAAISFTSIAVGGTNAADYAISGNTCGSSLAAAASCTVSATFTPTSPSGTRTAAIVFTDNATGSPQSVTLSGTALVKSLGASTGLLTFASQVVGSTSTAQSVTITNNGNATVTFSNVSLAGANAGDFAISANSCAGTLAVNATCAVSATFTPTATGTRTANISFSDDANGSPQTIALSGTGAGQVKTLGASTGLLTYISQLVGTTSAAQSVTITNNGNATVTFTSVALTGTNAGDFSINSNTCTSTLAANATCAVSAKFTPTATGTRTANISFTDDANGSPQTIALSGTGTAPTLTLSATPGSLTFASQLVGTTSAAQSTTIQNTGNGTVSFSSISLTGTNAGDFAIAANTCPASLTAGSTCSVSVTFTPAASGARAASISFTDNASGSPQSVALSGTGQATPVRTLSATTGMLTFASQVVGTTSGAQSVTLQNTGNATITFSSIAVTGSNAGDFAISGNTCGTTLAASATCTISATFTPTAAGTRSASITTTDDANGSPQTVALSGTGAAQVKTLSATTGLLTFASQLVGTTSAAQSVTLQNTGNATVTFASIAVTGTNTGDFAISGNTCGTTLAPSATCTISATFTPTAGGVRNASITTTDDANGSPQSVALAGTGTTPTLTLSFSPTSLPFGPQSTGTTSAAMNTTVSNTGSAAVSISSIAVTGTNAGDFAISGNTCPSSLTAGTSCSVSVTFTPGANGSRAAALTFTDNATGSPQIVALSGTGQTLTYTLSFNPASLAFAAQNTGATSGAQGVVVTNTGNSAVTLSSIAISGTNAGDFAISGNNCPSSLTAGNTCTVNVTFSPAAAGARAAALTFTDNATGSPQSVALSGTGQTPTYTISLNPTSLTFAAQNTGTTSGAQNVVVNNTGNAAVSFTSVAITGTNAGDFGISGNNCPSVLSAGSGCAVNVTFSPTANGSRTAALTFTDNATGSPQSVALSGTGQTQTFSISLNPTSLTFAAQNTGSTSGSQNVVVTNTGNAAVTLTSIALSGTNAGDFAISANNCPSSLTAGNACAVSVTFSPTANGSRTAALTFTDNAAGSPQSVALSGTGQTPTFTISLNPTSLTFAAQNTGTTSAGQNVTVSNTGNAAVSLTNVAIAGTNAGDFAIAGNNCPSSLAAGGGCTVTVTFSPTANGSRTAALTFTDSATGSPQSVALSGTGQTLTLTLSFSPTSLTFPAQNTGTTSGGTQLAITNTGTGAVAMNGFSFSGTNASDFAVLNNGCPQGGSTLAPTGSCYVYITFSPGAVGTRTANLQVLDNASGNPQSISLSGTGQAPTMLISFSPSSLTFGTVNTGANSAQSFNVSNTGNSPVTFTSFTVGGTNAGDFAITSNSCPSSPATLGVSATCSIQATFSPTAAGNRTANIVLTDNATGSPQSFPLSGTGQVQTITLGISPTSLTFAGQNLSTTSAAQSVTLSNTGNTAISFSGFSLGGTNAADYSITANTCPSSPSTLAAGGNCAITLTFTPSAVGTRTASLTITDNATGSPQSVAITGTGQNTSKILTFSPTSLSFTTVTTGNNTALNVNVQSTGTNAVTFSNIAISGANAGDFAISGNNCPNSPATLGASASCTVTVTFSPTATGTRTANLVFTDDATGTPQTVAMTGTGQAPASTISLSPTSYTYSTAVNIGSTSANSSFSITNTGTAAVSFTGITLGGTNAGDFAIVGNTCPQPVSTLAAGSACTVTFQFTPTASGSRTATITLVDNATGTPQHFTITGTGQTPTNTISFSPSSITFPVTTDGVTASQIYTYVQNTGNTPLTFNSITITGTNAADFHITNSTGCSTLSGNSLGAGGACYVYVNFTPSINGTETASLMFNDTASGSPQTVGLSGTGQTATQLLSFSPSSIAFSATTVGTTAQNYTYIQNTGTASLTLNTFTITGTNASDFTLSASTNCGALPYILTVGNQCYQYVNFTPTGTGSRTANLVITDTATGSPHTVPLSGSGTSSTPLTVTPASLTFSAQNMGTTSAAKSISLFNTGSVAVAISSVALGGTNAGDYALTNGCGSSIAANSNCQIMVTFSPTASGARTATVTITDSAAGSPQTVALTGTGQSATQSVSLQYTAITFPAQTLNSTSSALTTSVTNNGTGTVTIGGVSITGTNAADFTISNNTCTTLTASAGCTIYVTFSPLAAGVRTATLLISDTATGSPQSVTLSGTGVTSTQHLLISATALSYAAQLVGTSSTAGNFYLQNQGTGSTTINTTAITGTNASDFAFTSNACPNGTVLTSTQYCYIYIAFTPSAPGIRTATFTVTDSASGSPQTVTLLGVGQTSTSQLSLNASGLSFGSVNEYTTSAATYFYIYNVGTTPLSLNSMTVTGTNAGDFSISQNECPIAPATVAAGSNCYVYMQFTPTTTGLETASLQIADSATGSPHSVQLLGTGLPLTQTTSLQPNNISFGAVQLGSTSPASSSYFYVYNKGTTPLTFTSFNITGTNSGDFSVQSNTCPSSPATLAAGSGCYLYVQFTPMAVGPRSATIIVNDSAPDSGMQVSLIGTGQAPASLISLAPNQLSFAAQNLGTTAAQQYFYLYNKGTTAITLTSATLTGANSGDFAIASTTCGASIAVGSNCYYYITFTPTTVGPESASLQLTNSASGSPQSLALNGIGQSPVSQFRFYPANLVFPTQATGTTSGQMSIQVYNDGNTIQTLNSFSLTGTNASDFAITSNGCPIAPATFTVLNYCYVYITFTPSASGLRSASLRVTDTLTGSPQLVPITGLGSGSSQILQPSVTNIAFTGTNIGTVSSAQSFTLYNEGNTSITGISFSITGTNAGDFSISANNCPSTLTAGAGCSVNVTFDPTAVDFRTANLQITGSASNSPQTITLTGIGQVVTNNSLYFTLTDLTYGLQNVGTVSGAQGVSIYNEGTGAINFSGFTIAGSNASDFGISFNNCPSTLTPGAGCTVNVTFDPTVIGARTANLQITSTAAGSPQSVSLFGTGQAVTEQAYLSQTVMAFASQTVNTTSGAQGVNIYNEGTSTMTFNASNPFTITGTNSGDFSISYNNCGSTLTSGAGCTLNVTFRPSASGYRTATLQFGDDAPGSPQTVELTGTGVAATTTDVVQFTTMAFGTQVQGTASSAKSNYLYNYGTDTLNINGFTVTGPNSADFTISQNNCSSSLTTANACYFYVVFNPSTASNETATLTISSSANDSPATVNLTGTGLPQTQIVNLNASELTFAATNLGSTTSQQGVSIYNYGDVTMTFSGITITGANAGDFAISQNTCSTTLTAGAGCTVYVTFTPTAIDVRSATLNIADTATGSPQTVSLFGTGQTPTQIIEFAASSLNFGTSTVGTTSSQYSVSLYNVGNTTTTLNNFAIAGTNASEFAITSNNCGTTLTAGSGCTVYMKFTPAATGLRVANLQVTDSAGGSPQAVNLFGTGQ